MTANRDVIRIGEERPPAPVIDDRARITRKTNAPETRVMCRKNLHEMTPDNIYRRKDKRRASGYIEQCLSCNRLQRGLILAEERSCEWCKKKFITTDSKKITCSDTCRHARNNAKTSLRRRQGPSMRKRRSSVRLEVLIATYEDGADDLAIDKWNRPSSPGQYLKPDGNNTFGKATEALTRLNNELDWRIARNEPPTACRDNPAPFIDWVDPDIDGGAEVLPIPTRTQAKALCEDCPVNLLCREYGRIASEPGVWGGIRRDKSGREF